MSQHSSTAPAPTDVFRPLSAVGWDQVDVYAHGTAPSPGLRSASISLSEICGDEDKFDALRTGSRVTVTESAEHFDFVVDDLSTVEAGVTLTQGSRRLMSDLLFEPEDEEHACLKQLCEMVKVGQEDPYSISKYAPHLIALWLAFADGVSSHRTEAQFRGPVDLLIRHAFTGVRGDPPRLRTFVEVPLKPSLLPTAVHEHLWKFGATLAMDCKAYIDSAVLRNLEFVREFRYNHYALHPGFHGGDHLLAEVVIEYNVDNPLQMQNQVVLGMTASLYHRKRLGLLDKSVYGIGVHPDRVVWFYGCWMRYSCDDFNGSRSQDDSRYRISIATTVKPIGFALRTFADWMRFYVSLMRLRERLKNVEPITDAMIDISRMPGEQVIDDTSSMDPPVASSSLPSKRRLSGDNGTGSRKHLRTEQAESVLHDDSTVVCPTPIRQSTSPEWLVGQ